MDAQPADSEIVADLTAPGDLGTRPRLVLPTIVVAESFRGALEEFRTEGRLGPEDNSELATSLRAAGGVADEAWFAGYLEILRLRAEHPAPGRRAACGPNHQHRPVAGEPEPRQRVPSTTLWFVQDREFLGRLSIRHYLTPALGRIGGHIGYDVRPSARRRGHATAMLRSALPIAAGLGIHPALITCDDDNIASRRVIESAGGITAGGEGPALRFWVPTNRQFDDDEWPGAAG